jgi:hydroxypyruvate isomerase
MPRFAANLAYLFTERPFMERFGAAAAVGFTAVELQFPYDQLPSAVKAELERHGLTMLGINSPPGNVAGGEFGLAAVPGREQEFIVLFRQALEYVVAIGGARSTCSPARSRRSGARPPTRWR